MWFTKGNNLEKKQQASSEKRIDDKLDVASYIKEYLHLKKVSEGDITQNDDTSQNDEQPAEDIPEDQDMDADQKKDPPLHVTAVKEVSMIYASKYINYGLFVDTCITFMIWNWYLLNQPLSEL